MLKKVAPSLWKCWAAKASKGAEVKHNTTKSLQVTACNGRERSEGVEPWHEPWSSLHSTWRTGTKRSLKTQSSLLRAKNLTQEKTQQALQNIRIEYLFKSDEATHCWYARGSWLRCCPGFLKINPFPSSATLGLPNHMMPLAGILFLQISWLHCGLVCIPTHLPIYISIYRQYLSISLSLSRSLFLKVLGYYWWHVQSFILPN